MNQLYSRKQTNSNDFKSLVEFVKSTTPAEAKRQVENLLSSGKLSQNEFERLKVKATEIIKSLNL